METYQTFFFWGISFFALYFSVFWIVLLKTNEKKIRETPEIKSVPFVSFIIPTRNGAKTIARTLDTILKVDYPKNKYEVIIALNGCTDNTAAVVKPFLKHKNFRMIDVKIPEGKRGKAYAFNHTLKIARGSVIACLDDDTYISKDSLLYMIPMLQKESTAAVIPDCKVYNPRNFLQKLQVIEYAISSFSRKLLSFIGALYVTPGVLSIYKKDILVKAGGMDEHSLTEDFEIAVRLTKLGYGIDCQINSVSYTEVPNNLLDFHKQRLRWSRGFIMTIAKHKDMLLNPKHGVLGSFILPFILILAFFSIFVTAFLIYGYVKGIVFLITNISNFSLDYFKISIFDFSPLNVVIIILILTGIYFLYKSYGFLGYKWKYPLTTLIFLTYYQPLLASYWLFGMLYELAGFKHKW